MKKNMNSSDWKKFTGNSAPHNALKGLVVPPWRSSLPITEPEDFSNNPAALKAIERDAKKAEPFVSHEPMIRAVNAALYLRRPLLLTGKPGSGKSTLISKVAQELKMGPVLRWDINSRSTVRSGIYEYDAIGRLQHSRDEIVPPIEKYLALNALGTAMLGTTWPRALLIDEIDKGDLDLANDLLNVIEEGTYEIPELRRLGDEPINVPDGFGRHVEITKGLLRCNQFPFIVMTSNNEREFPPPFLRRCVRLTITPETNIEGLTAIVESHLGTFGDDRKAAVKKLVEDFAAKAKNPGTEVATDQLLNAVFLTVGRVQDPLRSFGGTEIEDLKTMLLEKLA